MSSVSSLFRTVTLKREGRSLEMQSSQVSTTNLKRVFHVDPASVWLIDDMDGTAYFPEPDGFFQGLASLHAFNVEGPDNAESSNATTRSTFSSTPIGRPAFRSVISNKSSSSKNSHGSSGSTETYRLRITKAVMTRTDCGAGGSNSKSRPSFTKLKQDFFIIEESTANVPYILKVVRERWGQSYILVGNNGLEIEDSPGTQGKCYVD